VAIRPSQRFPKANRVRRRAEFQKAFEAGSRVHGRFLTVVVAPNQSGAVRLGIVASRKLGDAVRRNRAKRLIREVFRQIPPLPVRQGVDVVVIPRRELFDAAYSNIESDFRSAFKRAVSRVPADGRR
jgi:ribonuclease P protein component